MTDPDLFSNPENLEDDEIKSCCAKLYESDLVSTLLGDSYHPGGLTLTKTLAKAANIRRGSAVLDVASGPGTSAVLLGTEFGANVLGVDIGMKTVEKAQANAAEHGLHNIEFRVGDAERLPVRNNSIDVVVCECAFCTFPDKQTAANEMARVLKPGGRVAIADVVLDQDSISEGLKSLIGWVACVADAKPVEQYVGYLEAASFTVDSIERHDDAMAEMIDAIDARISALKIVNLLPEELDPDQAAQLLKESRQAVDEGAIGYVTMVATASTL